MHMKTLQVTQAIRRGWSLFTRRGWYLFGLTAAVMGLAMLVIGNAVATALYSIIIGGYIAILLKHAREEKYVFDDLFLVDRRWVYFAFGMLIKAVLILLGLVCFIVPGVYLAVRWMFSELYIIDDGMRPLEALKASSALTEGYRWKLFGYLLLMMLIGLLGTLALGVGLFVAVPVINFATITLFWNLKKAQ